MQLRRAAASSAARTTRRIPARGSSAWSTSPARGPRDPGLHLGHHRQAQGRDALAPQHHLPARATPTPSSRCDERRRALVLPAALPHRRAHLRASSCRCTPARSLNFVENPETVPENVREIAPTVFFAVPRIWEKFYSGVAIRMKEATWLGRSRLRVGASASGYKVAEAELDGGQPVAGCLKLALPRSPTAWCSTTSSARSACTASRFAGTGAAPISPDLIKLVPGARRRHARGLRPDRELRRSPPACRRPHQARHGRHRRGRDTEVEDLARGRDPAARARTSSWAT